MITENKENPSFPSDPAGPGSSGSPYSGRLLLPGQASPDFSHGSERLGQAAAVISPLTLFYESSGGSPASLRKLHRARADAGLYGISVCSVFPTFAFTPQA